MKSSLSYRLNISAAMMFVTGISKTLKLKPNKVLDYSISGVAGVGYILL